MDKKHVYCIGIGGVGMAWIADYCLYKGWMLSGSDLVSTPLTERLEAAGAAIHYGSDPSKIPSDVTEVVINSAITETSGSYSELQEVQKRGLKVSKRAEWTGKITREHTTIAVCGTHGKTTTTAMVGWILEKAGLDPTVFVGGSLATWDYKTRIGSGKYLVIEADEYDRSFHNFSADIAIVLNIDPDHLDYYTGGIEEIEYSFRRFLRNLPMKKGIVVAYGKDKHIRKVTAGFSYKFRWYDENKLWPGLKLLIPGMHTLLDATAAARVAHELGVSQAVIKEALATFPGVGRRFEYLGTWNEVEVYDDYAHHPREISATLQGIREKFADQQVTVVFQPHQKARTQLLLSEFGRCFDKNSPDILILAPIYEVQGREGVEVISSQDVANEIMKKTHPAMKILVAATNEELAIVVRETSEKPGIIMSMGAGSISSLCRAWITEK